MSSDFDYLHLCIDFPGKFNKKGKPIENVFNIAKHEERELRKSINLHGFRHLILDSHQDNLGSIPL